MMCKICGNELSSKDRGRYYAGICRKCCIERDLCQDCGEPVEVESMNFTCTGYHYLKGKRLLLVEDN
jgi:hypothetical protein